MEAELLEKSHSSVSSELKKGQPPEITSADEQDMFDKAQANLPSHR